MNDGPITRAAIIVYLAGAFVAEVAIPLLTLFPLMVAAFAAFITLKMWHDTAGFFAIRAYRFGDSCQNVLRGRASAKDEFFGWWGRSFCWSVVAPKDEEEFPR